MDKNLISDACVVIRSVDERTTELCYDLVCRQVDPLNVLVIKESPFENALRKTFEIGIEKNLKWTFAIDADLLVLPDALGKMIKRCEKYSDYVFFYQGVMIDKLSLRCRQGGVHLYKTKYLKVGVDLLPKVGTQLRPESYVRQKMVERGYHFYQDPIIYSIHDFEQTLFDVYRKSFLNAIKRPKMVAGIIERWRIYMKNDPDFEAVIFGAMEGLVSSEKTLRPPSFFLESFEKVKERIKVEEKVSLKNTAITKYFVKNLISDLDEKLNYQGLGIDPKFQIRTDNSNKWAIKIGFRSFLFRLGHYFIRTGELLSNLSKKKPFKHLK